MFKVVLPHGTYYSENRKELEKMADEARDMYCNLDTFPIQEITKEEYILRDVPKEFHSVFSSYAYDKGHWAGENECNIILSNLVSEFLPSIIEFKNNLLEDR